MRRFINATVIVALLAACSNTEVLAPAPSPAAKVASSVLLGLNASQPVRISEFHYDNVGGDFSEWIEISGPGGTNLQGYTIVLYDGATGQSYGTRFLGGTIPTICSGRGVVLHMLPANGLQDGSPDGMALVGPGNNVIEFLSYEGSFTAVNGPASGMTSTDIGVFEDGNGPVSPVTSLWRFGATNVWAGPSQNTFGTCNDAVEPPAVDSVEVTPSSVTLIVGDTKQLAIKAFDVAHNVIPNMSFFWTSSAPSVATVTPAGLVTAVGAGDVLIIGSVSNGEADTTTVHVDRQLASSVEITPASMSIIVGVTQPFTAVAFDAAHHPIASVPFSWSSSNASIASVSASGLATGVAPGDALIIVTADGKADTAQIHVDPANHPPTARVNGPFTGLEASPVSMSGAASSDPDAGDVLSYAWTFGDGTSGAGDNVSHTYTQDGVYNVQLEVTDSQGLTSTVTTTATVGNVAPAIGAFAGGMLLPGETYTASGSFTDPGADSWTATVDYGDGSGVASLALSGKTFSLSHAYTSPGTFTVTVRVSDDDVTSSRAQTVTVSTVGKGVTDALALLAQLVAAGKIDQPNANPIREALEGVLAKLADDKIDLVVSQLETAWRHLDAAVTLGKISAADADPLKSQILRVLQSLGFSGFSTQSKGKRGG